MNKIQKRKTFMIIVGPSHAGKFLLLYPFQMEPRFGISDMYLWPNTIVQKFFKDAYNIDLINPNQTQGNVPDLDLLTLTNFNIDPSVTEYFKNDPDQFNFYFILVNSEFMTTIPRRLNNPFHIFLPTVRDPRVLFIVDRSTNDKNDSLFMEWFLKGINEFTDAYKRYISDKDRVSVIYFETLINKYEKTIEECILSYAGFKRFEGMNLDIKRPSQQINHFFTTDDRDNNKWFGYRDQKMLDLISEKCKDYIELFGYKPHLTVEEIYEGLD